MKFIIIACFLLSSFNAFAEDLFVKKIEIIWSESKAVPVRNRYGTYSLKESRVKEYTGKQSGLNDWIVVDKSAKITVTYFQPINKIYIFTRMTNQVSVRANTPAPYVKHDLLPKYSKSKQQFFEIDHTKLIQYPGVTFYVCRSPYFIKSKPECVQFLYSI